VRYSFLVRLSHPLLHAGLSRRFLRFLFAFFALQYLKICAACANFPVIWNTRTWGLTPAKAQRR